MDYFAGILESSTVPWLSAMVLGIMTAISPCPLVTNITAIGFISKEPENRNRVFFNGLLYTLGRAMTYFTIALIIYLGADQFEFSGFFQQNGEKFLGPLLLLIGLLMLDFIRIPFPALKRLTNRLENKKSWTKWDAVFLGILFALAFCPYSGVLYFGMLIPMTLGSSFGLYLPLVFAITTGIPVILFAWMLAYAVSGIGRVYSRVKSVEIRFRQIISVLFIVVGVYYIIRAYL